MVAWLAVLLPASVIDVVPVLATTGRRACARWTGRTPLVRSGRRPGPTGRRCCCGKNVAVPSGRRRSAPGSCGRRPCRCTSCETPAGVGIGEVVEDADVAPGSSSWLVDVRRAGSSAVGDPQQAQVSEPANVGLARRRPGRCTQRWGRGRGRYAADVADVRAGDAGRQDVPDVDAPDRVRRWPPVAVVGHVDPEGRHRAAVDQRAVHVAVRRRSDQLAGSSTACDALDDPSRGRPATIVTSVDVRNEAPMPSAPWTLSFIWLAPRRAGRLHRCAIGDPGLEHDLEDGALGHEPVAAGRRCPTVKMTRVGSRSGVHGRLRRVGRRAAPTRDVAPCRPGGSRRPSGCASRWCRGSRPGERSRPGRRAGTASQPRAGSAGWP